MKNLYDCHVHLNLPQYDDQRDGVIAESLSQLDFMINIGFDEESCEDSLVLSYRHDKISAALGFHPTSSSSWDQRTAHRLSGMLDEETVLALGEIGLDYYWMKDPEEIQKKVFYEQLCIAEEKGLPVIIHDRDAHGDVMDMITAFNGKVRGVMHSFSADTDFAKKAADMGWYFSVSGPVTFKNKKNDTLREAIASLPHDRILIETDSPYLSPHPLRGTINRPKNVLLVAEKVSSLLGLELDRFLEISRQNARDIFGI